MLTDEGTSVVKVFLHISKDEQRARLQARIDDPEKNWKFRSSDLESRSHWDDYQRRYEEAITATSTDWAPWYVVPGDHKWVRDVAVATLLVEVFSARIPDSAPERARAWWWSSRARNSPVEWSGWVRSGTMSDDGRRVAWSSLSAGRTR